MMLGHILKHDISVKKMKSEFATPKDLEKLRVEVASSKGGGGKIDPTHPDMGPIMDSLIMTSIYHLINNISCDMILFR